MYVIRYGVEGDVAGLPGIEVAAAGLFGEGELPEGIRGDATDVAVLAAAQGEGRLWVAADEGGVAVGFAYWVWQGEDIYLAEMDVHPDHGRRGLGRRLVMAVVEQARRKGAVAVTLTTFRDVAWNGPFYGRLGFEVIEGDVPEYLVGILDEQVAMGFVRAKRVAMRFPSAWVGDG